MLFVPLQESAVTLRSTGKDKRQKAQGNRRVVQYTEYSPVVHDSWNQTDVGNPCSQACILQARNSGGMEHQG